MLLTHTFTAHASAKPTPVLPDVGSIIVLTPGLILPSSSAFCIMRKAILSLTEPPALKNSHFTNKSHFKFSAISVLYKN